MKNPDTFVADALSRLNQVGEPIEVSLSNELVHLLSDQLYQSPLKAIEELVVNAYDADATECRIFVPSPDDESKNNIVVYDDGIGMNRNGLTPYFCAKIALSPVPRRTGEVQNFAQKSAYRF